MTDNNILALQTVLRQAVPPNASLVVIGAHHFGDDPNDPIYSAVSRIAWSDVLLVEASPTIAAQLHARVAARNPTRLVRPSRVNVVNQGVCPGEREQVLPFFTFLGAPGLPFWATQIGSFSRPHVEKHLAFFAKRSNYSAYALRERILVTPVVCTSLLSLLRSQSIQRLAVLLVDTEGLDCELVASQRWSSGEWCGGLSPTVLAFEWLHCSPDAYASAVAALQRHAQCDAQSRGRTAVEPMPFGPFRQIAESDENAFFSREPRRFFAGSFFGKHRR